MRQLYTWVLSAVILVGPLSAPADHPEHDHSDRRKAEAAAPIGPGPNEVLVTVHGLVCSFCAQGAERALGRLDGLDRSKYGNGIHVDIDHQRILMAFQPGVAVPREEIKRRIRKAGYDPIAIQLGPGL